MNWYEAKLYFAVVAVDAQAFKLKKAKLTYGTSLGREDEEHDEEEAHDDKHNDQDSLDQTVQVWQLNLWNGETQTSQPVTQASSLGRHR